MQEFIFLFRSSSTDNFSEAELSAYYSKWGKWFEKLVSEGKYISGDRLMSEDAKVVTGGDKIITDGPYAESKEIIGGLSKIRANNIEEAVETAKSCPIYEVGGCVEVRRIYS